MSPDGRRLPDPDALLRIAVGGSLAALVVCGVGQRLFGWDPGGLLQLLPGCAFRSATGISCPGCGMTRAFLLLAELRLADAFAANPASPALAAAMATWLLRPPRLSPRYRTLACGAALAAVLVAWANRCSYAGLQLLL